MVKLIKCTLLRRYKGQITAMPFAANFIAIREIPGPLTHWIRIEDIRSIKEGFMLRRGQWWRRLPFMPLRPEHVTVAVIVNEKYAVQGIDVINFLLELKLAKEIEN